MTFIVNIFLLSCAIFIVAKFMPSIQFKNIGTILTVAIVYSIINFLFGWIFFIVTFPLVMLTFGLFKFVINAFLLWITDKLIDDFKIDTFGSTLLAAFFITIIDSLLKWLL